MVADTQGIVPLTVHFSPGESKICAAAPAGGVAGPLLSLSFTLQIPLQGLVAALVDFQEGHENGTFVLPSPEVLGTVPETVVADAPTQEDEKGAAAAWAITAADAAIRPPPGLESLDEPSKPLPAYDAWDASWKEMVSNLNPLHRQYMRRTSWATWREIRGDASNRRKTGFELRDIRCLEEFVPVPLEQPENAKSKARRSTRSLGDSLTDASASSALQGALLVDAASAAAVAALSPPKASTGTDIAGIKSGQLARNGHSQQPGISVPASSTAAASSPSLVAGVAPGDALMLTDPTSATVSNQSMLNEIHFVAVPTLSATSPAAMRTAGSLRSWGSDMAGASEQELMWTGAPGDPYGLGRGRTVQAAGQATSWHNDMMEAAAAAAATGMVPPHHGVPIMAAMGFAPPRPPRQEDGAASNNGFRFANYSAPAGARWPLQ